MTDMPRRFGDRIAGSLLLALSIWYFMTASDFAVSYGDAAGPTLFPRILAVPLGLFSLFLVVRPDPDAPWARWAQAQSQIGALLILVGYPLLLEPMGFPLATSLGALLLAKILGGTWLASVLTGLVIGFGLFFVFDGVFGLPLPVGPLFG